MRCVLAYGFGLVVPGNGEVLGTDDGIGGEPYGLAMLSGALSSLFVRYFCGEKGKGIREYRE